MDPRWPGSMFFLPLKRGVDSRGLTLSDQGGFSPLKRGVDSHRLTLSDQGGFSPFKRGVDSQWPDCLCCVHLECLCHLCGGGTPNDFIPGVDRSEVRCTLKQLFIFECDQVLIMVQIIMIQYEYDMIWNRIRPNAESTKKRVNYWISTQKTSYKHNNKDLSHLQYMLTWQ